MKPNRGMNLLELLVVVTIIALLIAILLPSISPRSRPARRIMCMANLKAQGSVLAVYAASHDGEFPSSPAFSSLCDESVDFRNAMIGSDFPAALAARQKSFFCPSNLSQNPSALWEHDGISTWGYVWLNQRDPAPSPLPVVFPARNPPLTYHSSLRGPHPGTAELALDVIASDTDSGTINFSAGATPIAFGTNHLTSMKPDGANVLSLDGHVEWRKFTLAKATPIQIGAEYFWFPLP